MNSPLDVGSIVHVPIHTNSVNRYFPRLGRRASLCAPPQLIESWQTHSPASPSVPTYHQLDYYKLDLGSPLVHPASILVSHLCTKHAKHAVTGKTQARLDY